MWFWRVWMLNGVQSSACFRPIEHSRWEASGPKHAVASWIVIYVCWLPVSCHNLFCIPQNLMLLITRIDSRFPGNVCDSIFHYEVSICTVSPPSECPRNDNWPDSNHLTICPDLSKSVLWFESEECDLSDGLDVLQTLSRHHGLPGPLATAMQRLLIYGDFECLTTKAEQNKDLIGSYQEHHQVATKTRVAWNVFWDPSHFDLAQMHESPRFKHAKPVEIQIFTIADL